MTYQYSQDLLSGKVEDAQEEKPYSYSQSLLSGDISSQPLGSVMISLEEQQDPASAKTEFKTGIVDDPQARIAIYAASRFPDEPEEARIKRYGIHKDEIVYMGDDGKLYPETPDTFLGHAKRMVAREYAHLPTYLATLAAATASPALLPILTVAMGAEGARKLIGSAKYDEKQTSLGNVKSMALEGGSTLVGEGIGRGSQKFINDRMASRAGKIAQEAGLDRASINIGEVKRAEELGEMFDIEFFPHQTTRNPVLESKYKLLRDMEASMPVIRAADKRQAGQVDNAIDDFLDTFAPSTATPQKIGEELVDASKKAVQRPITIRKNKAKRIYDKAFKENPEVDIKPVIDFIDKELKNAKAGVRTHLLKAKRALEKPDLPKKEKITSAVDEYGQVMKTGAIKPKGKYETSLLGLHHSQMAIGDAIEAAKKPGTGSFAKRNYVKIKNLLLEQMDKSSPVYKRARKTYSSYSKEVEKQNTKTLIATLSKLEGDNMSTAVKKLFHSIASSPENVKKARRLIKKENPLVWNKITRVHLDNMFKHIQENRSMSTNVAGVFRQKIWGSKGKREIMESILDKKQFKYMGDFMEALERASIGFGKESATATRQVAIKDLQQTTTRKVIRAATRPLYTYQRIVGDQINETLLGQRAKALADVFVSTKAADKLKRLKQLPPKSLTYMRVFSDYLNQILGRDVKERYQKKKTRDVRPETMPQNFLLSE